MSPKENSSKTKPPKNIQSFLSKLDRLYFVSSLLAILVNITFALVIENEARTRIIDTLLKGRIFQFGVAILSILASFVGIFYFVQAIYRRKERQKQQLISQLQVREGEFFTRLRDDIHNLLQEGKIREQ